MNTCPDHHSPESFEDYINRGKTMSKIAAERQQALVEEIADLEAELENPCLGWPEEIRSLNDRLESAREKLSELRQQQADADKDALRFVDPKLSAADRNSGRF